MEKLHAFLSALPIPEREAFAKRCGTTYLYLRKAISAGQKLGESLCINIERESEREVKCEDVRPDVDWAYIRASATHAA